MFFDTHVHTSFSSDSKMNLKEAINKGKSVGYGIYSTDHLDLDYPDENKFHLDVKSYVGEYYPKRKENFYLGLEMGLSEASYNENTEIAENFKKLDYIIGSIHAVNGLDIYAELFAFEKDKKKIYESYLSDMHKNLKLYDCIHSLGHIDYICRYAPFEDKELNYNEYGDYIDSILKTLIHKEMALEINTKRLAQPKAFESLGIICKRYKDLGGKYVTVGSDAHKPEEIGLNFDKAKSIIAENSFKPVIFINGKMQYI